MGAAPDRPPLFLKGDSMKKILLLLILAPAAHAQGISPVISEARGPHVRGEFTVTNLQLVPVAVVIDPLTFSMDAKGNETYRPLPAGIDVKLDSTSTRLSPKQSYVFGYDIRCSSLPCVVHFQASLTGLHTREGIAISVRVPSIVYICEKQKDCRANVRKGWGVQ